MTRSAKIRELSKTMTDEQISEALRNTEWDLPCREFYRLTWIHNVLVPVHN